MSKNKKSNAQYWNKNVSSWEKSAYFKDKSSGQKSTLFDWLSTYFRGDSIYKRMDAALEIAKGHVTGLTVMDVGCASGRFALQLLNAGASNIIGVDVATSAIEMANQRLQETGYKDNASFIKVDVTERNNKLPEVDLVTCLGVIEYFDHVTLEIFMSNLSATYILFSFPLKPDTPAKVSLRQTLRSVYLKVKGCPGLFHYTKNDFSDMADKYGFKNLRFIREHRHQFVTNLPQIDSK